MEEEEEVVVEEEVDDMLVATLRSMALLPCKKDCKAMTSMGQIHVNI